MPRNVELYIFISSENDASGSNARIIYKCDVLQHPEETPLKSWKYISISQC